MIALVNASRGTLAYRLMVAAGKTQDKQSALSPQDLLGARRKVMGLVQRIWGPGSLAAPPAQVEVAASPVAIAAVPDAPRVTAVAEEAPRAVATVSSSSLPALTAPVLSAPAPAAPAAVDQFPEFDDAPEVNTLGDLVGSNPFHGIRALAFLAANVAAGLAFMLSRSLILPEPLHPVYWQFALLRGLAITLVTLLAFRFVRSGWTASVIAAVGSILLITTLSHFTLGTFTIGDVFYREQFQEFVLIPFVDVLVTLLGLFYLIPRVRPLALGLFVGAVCAEVATSMLITLLRDLGGGPAPDPVLAGTLVFFVGVRSLVFAATFWGGLRLAGIGRSAAK